ncbi:MAG: multiheme c-type cytochrome [Thermodesulfobacteriota bacterium]|nr:multiheme c-type cytochrome [Thermodesulfobacteriota bacterium]
MCKEQDNPECFKCYVAGANRTGGFVFAEETPHLTGKQCESCRGPGGHMRGHQALLKNGRR